MRHNRFHPSLRLGRLPALLALLLLGSSVLPAWSHPSAARSAPAPRPSPAKSVRWGATYFPNLPLYTHDGTLVHFYDDLLKDKVVLINFIYTTCPDACSLETARLVQVQRLLGARLGHDLFMYSITIDPEHDTPAVLAQYRARFQIGPGWLFLTGQRADIDVLRTKLGVPPAAAQDQARHSLSLLLGNVATGRWMKRSPMENPYFIATQLAEWLPNWTVPTAHPSYAQAPPLTPLAQGEYLFHTRCAACHSLGQGDGVGPDLAGVTQQRERAWLERWLQEPEKMLAEGDPIALALRTRYKEVAMPNLHLSARDVAALLTYLETHRPAAAPR